MTYNYATLVKNIFCVDVLNTSREEIRAFCLFNPSAQKIENFIAYFNRTILEEKVYNTNPQFIYFDDKHFIGSKKRGGTTGDLSIWTFEKMKRFTFITEQREILFYSAIEQELADKGALYLDSKLIRRFIAFFEGKQYFDMEFNHYANLFLAVTNPLRLNVNQIFEKFSIAIEFLDLEENFTSDSLKLCGLFYNNQVPILFVFNNSINEEYLGWNKDFLVALNSLKPINKRKKMTTAERLNTILDNINNSGIGAVSQEDIIFLNNL